MKVRLQYDRCELHDEPLNFLCLSSDCSRNRMICGICRQERHHEAPHSTKALKIYLCQKVEQLRCLSECEVNKIAEQLDKSKQKLVSLIKKLKKQLESKIQNLFQITNTYYNEKKSIIQKSHSIINKQQIQVRDLGIVQSVLDVVQHYVDHTDTFTSNIFHLQNFLSNLKVIQKFSPSWIGHPNLNLQSSIIKSQIEGYKVALLDKPIGKRFNKIKFRLKNNQKDKNWIFLGICDMKTAKEKQFGFRYYTIGHGMYGLSSNGGTWSNDYPEDNNKLGNFRFQNDEIVTIQYDINLHQLVFEKENGQKHWLKVKQKQDSFFHFCVILFYKNDLIQMIGQ